MQEPVPGISAVPDEQNARYFHVVVAGKNISWFAIKDQCYKKFDLFFRTRRFTLRGRCVQAGIILARGLPYVSSQSAIYH